MPSSPNWHTKAMTSTVGHVPAAPGLYAIGQPESISGLEVGRTIVYVGQTRNMRRRLSEHTHLAELNPGLAEFLRKNRQGTLIWYTTDVPRNHLDKLERELIQRIDPIFNRLKYTRATS